VWFRASLLGRVCVGNFRYGLEGFVSGFKGLASIAKDGGVYTDREYAPGAYVSLVLLQCARGRFEESSQAAKIVLE
jgi:hypothetical protein